LWLRRFTGATRNAMLARVMTEPNSKMDRATTPVPILLFAILTLVFLLNDIGFIWATNAAHWLGVDYGTKVLVIALVLAHSDARRAFLRGAGWPRPIWLALVGTIAVTAISIAGLAWIDEQGYDAATALQVFPRIDQTWLVVFDLTVGLALTAVAEELVFRRLYLDTFGARLSPLPLYLLSAAVFAAVHWVGDRCRNLRRRPDVAVADATDRQRPAGDRGALRHQLGVVLALSALGPRPR
jgi:membrane protease YdiL (CAAX protease family)